MTLAERAAELGGQFRLAGRQPTRGRILDLLDWYARRLAALGVDVRLGTYVTAGLVAEVAPDDVVVATGAVPARAGFQRAMPMVDRLPGIDDPSALAIHDVLAGTVDVGRHVLVVDDLGDWRGLGTALSLAESGRAVTIVTSAAVVGGGLVHSAVDGPLRKRFAAAGGAMLPSTVVLGWRPGEARLRTTLTGAESTFAADTLVVAETPRPVTDLAADLTARDLPFHLIGDAVAARRASLAFYEGRELGSRL